MGTPLRGSPGVATITGTSARSISKVSRYCAPGSLVTMRARLVLGRRRASREVVHDHLVGLEDAREAARLDAMLVSVACSSRASCPRPGPANSSTLPMPRPLEEGLAEDVQHHVLGAHARAGAAQHEAHRLGHLHAHVLGEPGVGHVGRADAEREAAERAGHAGVAVGARDHLARQRDVLDHRVVADGLAAAFSRSDGFTSP
jgi:hypothetical protein